MSGLVFLQPALEIYAGIPFVFRDSGKVQEGFRFLKYKLVLSFKINCF
jgi:hypothetical protein